MLESSVGASIAVALTWALTPPVGVTLLLFAAAAFVAAMRTVAGTVYGFQVSGGSRSRGWIDPRRHHASRIPRRTLLGERALTERRSLRARRCVRRALPRLDAPVRLHTTNLPHAGRALEPTL